MNNFIYGFIVGALSLIPGISGGTILFLTKYFNKFTYAIANIFNKQIRKENKFLIITFIIGILSGCLFCARIVEVLFMFLPNETLLFIGSLVLFSIPNLYKEIFKSSKINLIFFILGILIIGIISSKFINLDNVIITNYPKINIIFLLLFSICGFIDGFITILPGISGSMMMMILGPYFLYKSYLANLNLEHLIYLIPLAFYFIGDMLGIIYGSKVSCYLLKKYYNKTISLILGMVITSALVILPVNILNNLNSFIKAVLIIVLAFILTNIKIFKKVL